MVSHGSTTHARALSYSHSPCIQRRSSSTLALAAMGALRRCRPPRFPIWQATPDRSCKALVQFSVTKPSFWTRKETRAIPGETLMSQNGREVHADFRERAPGSRDLMHRSTIDARAIVKATLIVKRRRQCITSVRFRIAGDVRYRASWVRS